MSFFLLFKCAFSDPHLLPLFQNAYYEFKIKECEENGGAPKPKPPPKPAEEPAAPEPTAAAAAAAAQGIVRKQKMNALAKALMSKPAAKPAGPVFKLVHPIGLSAVDMDVIKLAAQYTAVMTCRCSFLCVYGMQYEMDEMQR